MEVKLLAHTINPAETVAVAGKGCYSAKPAYDIALPPEGVDKTLGVIHPSCYEHAVFTFSISGISRVTSHQLVRHRMASYSQQSQRYVKPKAVDGECMTFDYVVPESVLVRLNNLDMYEHAMKVINRAYTWLLKEGVPEEDARYLLPNACTTSIVVTMNARELQHFCGLRRCTRAQWEIRELADKMAQAAEEACPELFKHFSLGPQCVQLGYCPEHKSCGRMPTISVCIEGVNAKFPKLTEKDVAALKKAIENTPPDIFISGESREEVSNDSTLAYVPGRIAGETINEWTKHNTIPIATEEDLAQQKERAEDAATVAKAVIEKSVVPRCPKCGSKLVIEDNPLVIGRDPLACMVGCPTCNIWCESITKGGALNMFMEYWRKDE